MYAWFSQTAADRQGSSIYVTASGAEVEATCAVDDKAFPYNWPDKVYVGEVEAWMRQGARGTEARGAP